MTGCHGENTRTPKNGDAGQKSPDLQNASIALNFLGCANSGVGIMNPWSDFRYYLLTSSNRQAREHGNGDASEKFPGLTNASLALKFTGYTNSGVGIVNPSSDFRYHLSAPSNSPAKDEKH